MRYEYNGNLLEDDRINLVAEEIIEQYPQISFEMAKEVAMLEGRISNDKNIEMEFNRLYNIMLVMNGNKMIVKVVYEDLINSLKNNLEDDKINYYYDIALQIANYLIGTRGFPYLNEF